jgi:archaeosine-15-forming tRNA-guanine transglycosylase
VDKNGVITVEYGDGIKDTIYPDESKVRMYPNGRIQKISKDGEVTEGY